ncbi:hypothetical protein ICN48_12915 [Polynucleobacter sp. JS-Safj-400b-B2]|uniref:hypothetical protein n=1 Tax=Polynucleobacter sp. JS-Safj-400b-B2 TaxID=2576921 RepID=UPI001C0DB3A3|nr:hypothetical protein [Polynucleobacter sp. JS-Safj-400b-B2]MBU3627130.1 hypothetical protein [Polynucleobacter sp. JS-Safj-400b-B2]
MIVEFIRNALPYNLGEKINLGEEAAKALIERGLAKEAIEISTFDKIVQSGKVAIEKVESEVVSEANSEIKALTGKSAK